MPNRSATLAEALALVDRKDTELVAVLRELLAIDTTNPPGTGYERMVDYLDSRFRRLGFRNQRVIVPEAQWRELPLPLEGARVNLACRRQYGPEREEITITAHMDTVPVQGDWQYDPFCGPIELGRIYGRGVSDAKGAIASLLVAFEVLGQLRLESRYNVTLCFTTDEEIGVCPGVIELARRGLFEGHVLNLEGSQEPQEFVAAAGMVDVHVTTKGISCHTGINFLGINAVEEMLPIIGELMVLKRKVESRRTSIPGPDYDGLRPAYMTPTFTISELRGGIKSNVVPDECSLVVNRRYTPEETQSEVIAEILAAVERGRERSRAVNVVTQVMPGFPAFRCNLDNPHAARLREAKKLIAGYKDEEFRRVALTHSYSLGYVRRQSDLLDCYFLGVGRPDSREHGVDECCRLSDLSNLTKELIYYLTA